MMKRFFAPILLLSALIFMDASVHAAREGAVVDRVIDGDTLVLRSGEKLRLIGVDTPETNNQARNNKSALRFRLDPKKVGLYAQKAKKYTQSEMLGKKVKLEYDKEARDRFGRELVYMYRVPDGLFLNAELIKNGYGFAYLKFPFEQSENFKRYQEEARRNKKGIWSSGNEKGV